MQNQQLIDYINQQLQQGVPIDAIKIALRQSGWNENDVNQAMSAVSIPHPNSNPNGSPGQMQVKPKSGRLVWELLILIILIVAGAVVYVLYPDLAKSLISNLGI